MTHAVERIFWLIDSSDINPIITAGILWINTVSVEVRDLKRHSGGAQRRNKKRRIPVVLLLCLVPLICWGRPGLVALILLFCYAGLDICFHRTSIICASPASQLHMSESHFPSYCAIVVTPKQSRGHRNARSQQPWKGGGGIKRSISWMSGWSRRSDKRVH